MSIAGFDLAADVIALGAITGMLYGILGVGLVLVYRSNRIINFAHGDIGAFGAAVLGTASVNSPVPYWVLFVMALGVSATIGAATDRVIVSKLRNAPVILSIVATLGLGGVLSTMSAIINSSAGAGQVFPQPSFLPDFEVGALRVTPAYSAMLFVTPILVAALTVFLRRSRLGVGIRASAANGDAARMAGILPERMSAVAWAIAGALAAYTAILVLPTRGFTGARFLGPALLLRALAPSVIGRMENLPVTMAAGIGFGVIERLLLSNYRQAGLVEAVMFFVILGALLTQRGRTGRSEEKGSWAVVQSWAPLPDSYHKVFAIHHLRWIVFYAILGVGLLVPVLATNATATVFVSIFAFTLVGLSLGIVTGLGGQLSLGQFALAGVGATASYVVTRHGGNFVLGILAAGVTAAAVSTVIGLPALRIRGLMLAVTTLAFALFGETWLFNQSWMLGSGATTRRPAIGDTTFDTARSYYFVAFAILGVGFWLTRNIWRGGLGRRLRAVRDNEDAARAFTIPATLVKLQGFVIAGFVAGLGGAVYGHLISQISSATFTIELSINAAAVVVLGGLGLSMAPLLGAFYIIGIPAFLPLDNAGLAATAAGWLVLILNFPGGISQALAPARDAIVDALARRAGLDPDLERAATGEQAGDRTAVSAAVRILPTSSRAVMVPADGVILEAREVSKHFGGLTAVDAVTIRVSPGETLGLIGPNGAGKTTLFELLSGFTTSDSGQVWYCGRDVTGMGPERRGQLGLIRSFQDAALFPTLTVLEAAMLSLERREPTRFFPSVLGMTSAERRKTVRAHELVDLMGLHQFRNRQIRELSTGTRRITELACLVALEPTVLLLDEPTSGIAQRETEALGRVLQRIKTELDLTLVVIEHDIPLVMSISDRIVAMVSGQVIADGPPALVANDPQVVASYLGTDVRAIERSDRREAEPRVRTPEIVSSAP